MNTIPFSIEYYNAHPDCKVVDRKGNPVRVLCTDAVNKANRPVSALPSDGYSRNYNPDGALDDTGEHSELDLFIAVEPKLRPWRPEEAAGKVVRCKMWSGGIFAVITAVSPHEFNVPCRDSGSSAVTPEEMLLDYVQLDGTPCGVEE